MTPIFSRSLCKASLLSSALLSPAVGQEQDLQTSATSPTIESSAPLDPSSIAIETTNPGKTSLSQEQSLQFLSADNLNTDNFEPSATFLRINNSEDSPVYYRLNKAPNPSAENLLAGHSFIVIGPIKGKEQIRLTEEFLRNQGFTLDERGAGNFIEEQLQFKPAKLSIPTVDMAWYEDPRMWQNIGTTLVVFGGLVIGALAFGAIPLMHLRSLGGRFKASVRQFEDAPDQSFDDVGGCEHVVEEMRELSEEIKAVRAGSLSPRELPRGIIFEGSPGAGKTLLARATAGEVECPFVYVNCSAITASKWMGDWTAALLDVFTQARKARDIDTKRLKKLHGKNAPVQGIAIVFMDEFDTIGTSRSADSGNISGNLLELNHVVNALLAEMDGVDSGLNQGIIVLAATNLVHTLDSALVRPGRFSRTIHVPTPISEAQRRDILQRLSRVLVDKHGYSFAEEEPFEMLAKITIGDTGDYLRGILAESVSLARREDTKVITQGHLLEAFQRQKYGRAHENYLSQQRQRLVAYHEHGHALVGLVCGIEPFVVSMKPRGETAGRVILDPNATYQPPMSVRDMKGMILISLGGRAAELKYFGSSGITDGAAADLANCRRLIQRGVSFGMLNNVYSEEALGRRSRLPDRVKKIIDEQISLGLKIAGEILQAIGEEAMNRLVNDSLALDRELTGIEAKEFYEARVPAETLRLAREIAQRHLSETDHRKAYIGD